MLRGARAWTGHRADGESGVTAPAMTEAPGVPLDRAALVAAASPHVDRARRCLRAADAWRDEALRFARRGEWDAASESFRHEATFRERALQPPVEGPYR